MMSPSNLWPICGVQAESVEHLFISCEMAGKMWELIIKWLDIQIGNFRHRSEFFEKVDRTKMVTTKKQVIQTVGCTSLWFLWKYRNDVVHESKKIKKSARSVDDGSIAYGYPFVDCAALRFWDGSISNDASCASCAALGALLMQVSPADVLFESQCKSPFMSAEENKPEEDSIRIKDLAYNETNFLEDVNLITSDEDELLRECVFQLANMDDDLKKRSTSVRCQCLANSSFEPPKTQQSSRK
ncbi:hypothetical protein LXL04_023795 [Taraxacum kok-saghyz]